jgi:hypothetical protein
MSHRASALVIMIAYISLFVGGIVLRSSGAMTLTNSTTTYVYNNIGFEGSVVNRGSRVCNTPWCCEDSDLFAGTS